MSVSALTILGVGAPAFAVESTPSESESQFLEASGIDLTAPELAGTFATSEGYVEDVAYSEGSAFSGISDRVRLLNGPLGHLARVPLVNNDVRSNGLVSVGQSDIVGYSHTPTSLEALAANGAVGPVTGDFTEVISGGSTVHLASMFDPLGTDILQELDEHSVGILSEINLQLGTAASRITDGSYSDPDAQYRLSDLRLELKSPLLRSLPDVVQGGMELATITAAEALELVAPGGTISLPAGTIDNIPLQVPIGSRTIDMGTLAVDAAQLTVTSPNFNSVVSGVMGAGEVVVTSDDGMAVVNLSTGAISIDLAGLLYGGDVNGLDPNTQVFTPENMSLISASVANALSKTTDLFLNPAFEAIKDVTVSVSADLSVTGGDDLPSGLSGATIAGGTLAGSGTINEFAAGDSVFTSSLTQAPGLPSCLLKIVVCIIQTSTAVTATINLINNTVVPVVLPGVFAGLSAGIIEAIDFGRDEVIEAVQPEVEKVYGKIAGAFNGLLPKLADVVINEQIEDDGVYLVRAVGITLLPNLHSSARAHLGFASSMVYAVADPAVEIVEDEVYDGDTIQVLGTGWNPEPAFVAFATSGDGSGGQVELVLTDDDDEVVGDPILVDVDSAGGIETTMLIPKGTEAGILTLTATQDEFVRTDTVEVLNHAVPPTPVDPVNPAQPSGNLPVTGGSDSSLLWFGGAAVLLLALGAGAVMLARARRQQ